MTVLCSAVIAVFYWQWHVRLSQLFSAISVILCSAGGVWLLHSTDSGLLFFSVMFCWQCHLLCVCLCVSLTLSLKHTHAHTACVCVCVSLSLSLSLSHSFSQEHTHTHRVLLLVLCSAVSVVYCCQCCILLSVLHSADSVLLLCSAVAVMFRCQCYVLLQTPSKVLVYGILPPTAAIVDYAVGLRKLSANEQFFVGAQMVVRL